MPRSDTTPRLFTPEQANAMLPLVRAILTDLVATSREVLDRRQRVTALMAGRDLDVGDLYAAELAQIQASLQEDLQRVQGYIDELTELGVETQSATDGLVDFPCLLDGRVVHLCWQLGEAEVGHWHEVDGGFASRQPLCEDRLAPSVTDNEDDTLLA